MKLSAKSTAVTFLATMALGVAAFGGCTVTSTTSSDTDGGTSSSSSSSSSSGSTSSSSGGADGGDAATGGQCTDSKQTSMFSPPAYGAACQACANDKCCDKLTACFGQEGDADAGTVGCNGYKDLIDACNADPQNDTQQKLAECYGFADATTTQAVITAFDIMQSCLEQSCLNECTPQ